MKPLEERIEALKLTPSDFGTGTFIQREILCDGCLETQSRTAGDGNLCHRCRLIDNAENDEFREVVAVYYADEVMWFEDTQHYMKYAERFVDAELI